MIVGGVALLGLAAVATAVGGGGGSKPSLAGGDGAYPFRQARFYRPGRKLGNPIWLVLHTAEDHELPNEARGLQAYAVNPSDGRQVSWHYAVDNNGVYQSVREGDTAFAAGPGNALGIHIELVGAALQGATGWSDAYSQAELKLAASLAREIILRHGIPAERLRAEDLLARRGGITDHAEISKAAALARERNFAFQPWYDPARRPTWLTTNHFDVGPTFPWDEFLARVKSGGEEPPLPNV